MIDNKTEEVLADIFGHVSGWNADDVQTTKMSPGFPLIRDFASLLANEPSEESMQKFLKEHPQLLLGLFGQGDDCDLAFLTKPPIGTAFRADFAILNANQGGCRITLIDLENPSEPLFTKQGTAAKMLQRALGQIQDWQDWITPNKQTFVSDTVATAKAVAEYPARSPNGSFRLRSTQGVEDAWRAFDGFKNSFVNYGIVIGRWSQLDAKHRSRLVSVNRQDYPLRAVFTYEQVARRAYDRPAVWP
jgi:Domain of unknown function (DUF4263)